MTHVDPVLNLILATSLNRLVHPWPLRAPPSESAPPFIAWRTFPAVLCVLHLTWHSRSFLTFCFFRFVCVRVLRVRHRGRAWHRRGCQWVLAGRGGVARSAVADFVARRRVCLETRRKHDWALSGLLMWFWLYYVRVYKGRCDTQNKIQAVLIFATKPKINERATHSESQLCRAGERGQR